MRSFALLVGLLSASAFAEVSFEEARAHTLAKVQANSNDAAARYEYGRVLLYGWAFSAIPLPATMVDGELYWPTDSSIRLVRIQDSIPTAQEAEYLKEATKQFMRAARINSGKSLYALANAFAFEQLGTYHASVLNGKSFGDFADAEAIWDKVEAEYRRAYSVAKDYDKKGYTKGPDAPVSGEAARALIRLHEEKKIKITKAEIDRLAAHLKALGLS